MRTAQNLVRAATRAILANDDLEPRIDITTGGGRVRIEVDASPFDPAPLIGSGGTMKFALQAILAGPAHPSSWELIFRTSGRLMSPKLRDLPPTVEPMAAFVAAAVQHWRAQGREAAGSVELSPTAVIAIFALDDQLANTQRGAISRVIRAIGKANGYRGAAIVEKPAIAGK